MRVTLWKYESLKIAEASIKKPAMWPENGFLGLISCIQNMAMKIAKIHVIACAKNICMHRGPSTAKKGTALQSSNSFTKDISEEKLE